MPVALRPDSISTRQTRIAELAKNLPGSALSTLAQHMDLAWLHEAYLRTRKDGAAGVDGQTADEYAVELESNLESLLSRAKTGTYRAPAVRRVHIPKGDGTKTRPIGIPTFEDKVLQRGVAMLLEPVYEQEFYDFSYGFRPRRSAHDALEALWRGVMDMGGGWVLDVDIQGFFDNLDRKELRDILRQRVVDGVVVRLVGKWLRAGVLDGGVLSYPGKGTPQGGVISPLLANIYLHTALDGWWANDVLPRLRGRAFAIRYADDFVLVFSHHEDALKVQEVLPKRMARFGLTVHPEQTRLVDFRPGAGGGKPGTFDFLGFTHYWGRSKRGRPVLKRKTARDRVRRSLRNANQWLRRVRHEPVRQQAAWLSRKLVGYYNYYGISGNWDALATFRYRVTVLWRKWLGRRSQRAYLTWAKFTAIMARYPLPTPRIKRRPRQGRLAYG